MRMNAVIFSLLCVLVFPRASTGSWNLGPKLQVAKGGYPRALRLQNDGKWLACAGVSEGTGMPKVLRVYTAASPGGPWSILSTVIEASGAVDLANCFLYELPRNGTLLAAFRLHSGIMANGTAASYSLQTRRSFDGGKSWSASSVVYASPLYGSWEPFLYARGPTLHCIFALELAPHWKGIAHIEQDIAGVMSTDGGATWSSSSPSTLIHTPGSRNGMPSLAVLKDNKTLALAFEGFFSPPNKTWGDFTVQLAISKDDGVTWPNHDIQVVHAPKSRKAGAPQVAVDPADGTVFVSFMTDEDVEPGYVKPNYVDNCTVRVAVSTGAVAPLRWNPQTILAAGYRSFWPAVFSVGGEEDAGVWLTWGDGQGSAFLRTIKTDSLSSFYSR